MAIGTPFHSRTAPLNHSYNWRQWSGYLASGSYDNFHQPEYAAIRNGAALIDVSPLYKYLVKGRDAEVFIDRLVTRDASKLRVGQVIYTPWCDSDGKVLQEGTVMRFGEEAFQINATEPALRWLELNRPGFELELEDVSETLASLAIQGPRSRALLSRVADSAVENLGFFRLTRAMIAGVEVVISRTGYTGDLGYEVWMQSDAAERVWDELMQQGEVYGARPCGLMAMDVARIEAGFVLLDVDYINSEKALIPSQKSSPYELGLGWSVNLKKKADFIGRRALTREKKAGSPWQLVGLEIEWQPLEDLYATAGLMPDLPTVPWRTPVPIYAGGRQVGRATSGCWSTLLKKYIVITSLETPFAKLDSMVEMEVTVDYQRRQAPAKVVSLPFFRPERMRE